MEYCKYCGHEGQTRGVEEHRLIGGRGDGMRLFEVRNGLGLEVTVAADRCADLYRVSFMGRNIISVKIIVTNSARYAKILSWRELHRNGQH